ncbi:uncharacterized protein CLUP02_16444 [Colletotrichum lupini]|uniref:Uncharacterized protein n=1 Tax=Colletotrichum lupini TaxID=145971 RepID=A0A9Q8T851_9PEZI|nr:uncharacterized protein CLUP02_16444 [Colletotrichum lupini]UQC90912.1 hypothetical protein CLUP02_16444 [Colletotrichum lupini]
MRKMDGLYGSDEVMTGGANHKRKRTLICSENESLSTLLQICMDMVERTLPVSVYLTRCECPPVKTWQDARCTGEWTPTWPQKQQDFLIVFPHWQLHPISIVCKPVTFIHPQTACRLAPRCLAREVVIVDGRWAWAAASTGTADWQDALGQANLAGCWREVWPRDLGPGHGSLGAALHDDSDDDTLPSSSFLFHSCGFLQLLLGSNSVFNVLVNLSTRSLLERVSDVYSRSVSSSLSFAAPPNHSDPTDNISTAFSHQTY